MIELQLGCTAIVLLYLGLRLRHEPARLAFLGRFALFVVTLFGDGGFAGVTFGLLSGLTTTCDKHKGKGGDDRRRDHPAAGWTLHSHRVPSVVGLVGFPVVAARAHRNRCSET